MREWCVSGHLQRVRGAPPHVHRVGAKAVHWVLHLGARGQASARVGSGRQLHVVDHAFGSGVGRHDALPLLGRRAVASPGLLGHDLVARGQGLEAAPVRLAERLVGTDVPLLVSFPSLATRGTRCHAEPVAGSVVEPRGIVGTVRGKVVTAYA